MAAPAIISNPARVYDFVSQYLPVALTAGAKGIGLERDGELIAGVIYEGHSGTNLWMHVAAKPGARWATPEFLEAAFSYPFVQLGCDRVTGYVDASNTAARKFDEHLGFKKEAILKGAAHDGGDVILYVMWKKDCRYVHPV